MSSTQNISNSNNGQQPGFSITPVLFAHWVGAVDNTEEALVPHGHLVEEKNNLCLSPSDDWQAGFSRD